MAKKDFSSDQPAPQGVAPGTAAPSTSDTPTTGFSNPGKGKRERAEFGPGEAIPPSNRKIR